MMFKHRFHDAIMAGEITRTYRRWKRPQVVAGNHYKLGANGYIEVTTFTEVPDGAKLNLASTGLEADDPLVTGLGSGQGNLYCIEFRYAGAQPQLEPDRGVPASDEDLEALHRKLEQKDARRERPWTLQLLELINEHPGTGSKVLCQHMNCDQPALKQDVRKLKALGLTISLETGYKLSPRGRAYLTWHHINK